MCTQKLCGQTPFDASYLNTARKIKEHLAIFTDRSLYVIDETVRFRADYFIQGLEHFPWSSVLYVEIVAFSGTSIAQGKYPIENGLCIGGITVPPQTLTGNYFLKCYTRWMRNAGPESFSFVPIKIINPNRLEVLMNSIGSVNETQKLSRIFRSGELTCSTDGSAYTRGAEVSLLLTNEFNTNPDSIHCCITVVQVGAVDTILGQMGASIEPYGSEYFRVSYLPDLGIGPTISGTVIRSDQSPAKYALLHFSILGENPDFMSKSTDAFGRFTFSTPNRSGKHEFYVSASLKETAVLEVKVDQEFDTSPLRLPGFEFNLSQQERELALRMAQNCQFSHAYVRPIEVVPDSTRVIHIPFYGSNAEVIRMDDYVSLPTLEEVFINIVSRVSIARKRGKSSLRIHSDRDDIGFYPPLILIDNIAVFDQDAVLSLPSSKIERVEFITDTYAKGENLFGGLIAIYSRKGDMAGIDLPPGSYFFDYQSFHPDEPALALSVNPEDQLPDSRNTVLWLPDVLIGSGDSTKIAFTAPTLRGKYVVLVRGMAPNGQILSAITIFTVE